MKQFKPIIFVLIIVLIITGCVSKREAEINYENKDIAILYFDESTFFQLYGDFVRSKFPGINVTVIPSKGKTNEEVKEIITQQQPDIMVLDNITLFQQLIATNQVSSLELDNDKDFKFNEINPMIVDSLKEIGNGTLYGLTPFYNNRALFYNKEIFEEYSIAYPTDNMTWQEVFLTSDMFQQEHEVYGLDPWVSELDFIINVVGKTANLSLVQPTDLTVSIQTDQWLTVWSNTMNAYEGGSLFLQNNDPNQQIISSEDLVYNDIFLSGKAAMAYRSPSFMMQLQQTNIQWGVVTEPVSESDRNLSTGISFNEIMTINSKTQNKDFTLEVFKYLNGAELTQVRSRQLIGLPSRTMSEWNGHDISSLYKLTPNVNSMYTNNLPLEFWEEFYVKCAEVFEVLKRNELEVADMLNELQIWTELLLEKYVDEGKIQLQAS